MPTHVPVITEPDCGETYIVTIKFINGHSLLFKLALALFGQHLTIILTIILLVAYLAYCHRIARLLKFIKYISAHSAESNSLQKWDILVM